MLLAHALHAQAVGVVGGLAVVAQTEVLVIMVAQPGSHFADAVVAVGIRAVVVQGAAQVAVFEQMRQLLLGGEGNFAQTFA